MFTVVIPTFNRLKFLRRAIQSCLDQDFNGAFELVVINDGGEVVCAEDLPSRDGVEVRIENIEHMGVSAARNHGIAIAKGEWILLLDDDDFFLPNHLRIISDYLPIIPSSVGWVSTNCLQLKDGGTLVHIAKKSGLLSLRDFLSWDIITTNVSCFRKAFHTNFPINVNYLEDFEHRLAIIRQGGYYRIGEITSVFDSTHQSATNRTLHSQEIIDIYLSRYDEIFSKLPELKNFKNRWVAPWLWLKFSDLSRAIEKREAWKTWLTLAANLHYINNVTPKDLLSITLKRKLFGQ